jgi:hypothetical protein
MMVMAVVVVSAHGHRVLVVRVMVTVMAEFRLSIVIQVVIVVLLVLRLHVMHIWRRGKGRENRLSHGWCRDATRFSVHRVTRKSPPRDPNLSNKNVSRVLRLRKSTRKCKFYLPTHDTSTHTHTQVDTRARLGSVKICKFPQPAMGRSTENPFRRSRERKKNFPPCKIHHIAHIKLIDWFLSE